MTSYVAQVVNLRSALEDIRASVLNNWQLLWQRKGHIIVVLNISYGFLYLKNVSGLNLMHMELQEESSGHYEKL